MRCAPSPCTYHAIVVRLLNCRLCRTPAVFVRPTQVNQCELGRPTRQLRDMGASEGGSGSSLQKPTAASSRRGATGSSRSR